MRRGWVCVVVLLAVMGLFSGCESNSGGGGDLSGVVWLNTDVSGWAETSSLTATLNSGTLTLDYDKRASWPAKDNVNASGWVIFRYKGQRYAATFDYMRPGQTTKEVGEMRITGPGVNWRPSAGEEIGFMVSGLARDARRTVQERSNVSYATW